MTKIVQFLSCDNLPLFRWAKQKPERKMRHSRTAAIIQRRYNVSLAYARIIETDHYGVGS